MSANVVGEGTEGREHCGPAEGVMGGDILKAIYESRSRTVHFMDDLKELHPGDDYSHRFFIWHEWIQAHGPLSTENVFDYFSTSMFYDKQSNNQVLRMQTIHTGTPFLNEADELRSVPTPASPPCS